MEKQHFDNLVQSIKEMKLILKGKLKGKGRTNIKGSPVPGFRATSRLSRRPDCPP